LRGKRKASTDRRKAKSSSVSSRVKLRESEERYRSLFDRMLDGFYLSTHEGRFVDVNPAFVRMFGYASKKEMLDIADIKKELYFSPEERGSHVLDTGKEIEAYPMRRKDGSEIWVEDHGRYIHDEKGNVIYHEGILRDVTERKRMEEKLNRYSVSLEQIVAERTGRLAESERRFRELTELLPQIVYETDEKGVFTYVNHVGLTSTGYTEDELRNREKNFLQLVPPEEYGKISQSLARRDEKQPVSLELKVLRKDGSVFPALVYATAIMHEGKIVGFRGIAVDITERKRTEEELRAARNRLEHALTSSPAVIYVGKPLADCSNWHLTYISDRVTTMLGYEPTEIIGHPEFWQNHIHKDDLEPTMMAIPQIFKEGKGMLAYRILHKDLTYRWIRERAIVVRGPDGKPIEVNGNWTDITELKRSEEATRESEARYHRLFENSPISLWEEDFSEVKNYFESLRKTGVKDLRAYLTQHPDELTKCASMVKILDVNEATLKLYDLRSVHEIIGELRRVLRHESLESFREELAALWEGKTQFSSDFDNQTLTGETKHMNLMLNVVPGYEDTLGKVLVSIVDLTERKRMEEELRISRDRLELVLATNPAVLYFEEPLSDFSDTYSTFVSESARFVLGFEPKMFLGEPGLSFWRSRIQPDDLARYRAELPSLWRDGHHTFEYRFLHSDGTYRWITEQYRVVRDAQGRISHAVAVAIDATERKQLEEKLARAERLAAVGETAAMVGHDLRNPLQGIAGAISLLQEGSLTEQERKEMLQLIQKSIDYSNSIVRDLSEYSSEIQLRLGEASPRSIIQSSMRAVKMPGNVTVRDSSEDQPPITIDSDRMRRVFINLIQNAVDAMPQGGTLTVSTKIIDRQNIGFTITDTGSGMSEKVMENLWKPLHTTKAKGLGLGLAIRKRIVETHGGNISVKTGVGEGTTVTVHLPIKPSLVEVRQR